MILIVLRILFGVLLAATIYEAWKNGQTNLERGDILNAFYVAVSVGLAMLNAIVWAPYFGSKLSDPLTGAVTKSTYVERYNYLLRLIRWLDNRGFRALTRWLCFVEGIRNPSQPTQFAIGLNNARPGSWLEKVYALEVFRFHNIQNCVHAFHLLRQHGIDPRPHANHEVNIVLMSLEREARPTPEVLVLPKAQNPARPARNAKIKLFDGAPAPIPSASAKAARAAAVGEDQGNGRAGDAEAELMRNATPAASYPAWLQALWTRILRFIETH
jgi:hypothetical protein